MSDVPNNPAPAVPAMTLTRAAGVLVAAMLGMIPAGWVLFIFSSIALLSVCDYGVLVTPVRWHYRWLLILLPVGFLVGLAAWRRRAEVPASSNWGSAVALAPAVGLVPLWLGQPNFAQLCLGLLLLGLVLFRGLCHHGAPGVTWTGQLPRWCWSWAVVGAILGLTVYAAIFQMRAMQAGRLSYSDWALYLEVVLNTLRGKWFLLNEFNRNMMGFHLMPGAALLLLPVVLLHSHWVIFVLNGLALYGGGILLYQLARDLGHGRRVAACLALCYLAHPALSNMTFAMGYGFHSIYLVMPLIPAFFLLDRRGHRKWAWAVFLFSLTINETVGIFWTGVGAGLALTESEGRRRYAVLAAVAFLYSLVAIKWVIPAISGMPSYDFIQRYANLGGSYREILLSPLTNPQGFFGTVFRPETIYYLLLLVIPALWLAAARPGLLLCGSLIMTGVCLQGSKQTNVLPLQYHSEYVIWLQVLAVLGATRLKLTAPWFHRLLGFPDAGIGGRKLTVAATLTGLVMAVLCFNLLALVPWSKNSMSDAAAAPPLTSHLAEFEALVPEVIDFSVTPFLASNYLFRNNVFYPSSKLCDYVFLDLGEYYRFGTSFETQRRQLLESPEYACVKTKSCGAHFLMLFRKTDAPEDQALAEPCPPLVDEAAWAGFGAVPATWTERSISCRMRVVATSPRTMALTISLRLEEPFDHDVDLHLTVMSRDGGVTTMLLPFGNGIWPAYRLKRQATWTFTLNDLPQDVAAAMKVVHKPPPR